MSAEPTQVCQKCYKAIIPYEKHICQERPFEVNTESDIDNSLFKQAALPLMEYLSAHHHPHVTVIVTAMNAELLEGQMVAQNNQLLEPTPQNAPLMNEGGETVEQAAERLYPFKRIIEITDTSNDMAEEGCKRIRAAFVAGYHHRDTEVATLQTALAEYKQREVELMQQITFLEGVADSANNKIAELESKLAVAINSNWKED